MSKRAQLPPAIIDNLEDEIGSALSKSSTINAQKMILNGNYREAFELVSNVHSSKQEAIKIRALTLMGEFSQAKKLLGDLNLQTKCPWSQTLNSISFAYLARQERNWSLSKQVSEEALGIALNLNQDDLIPELLFSLGISLVELDFFYRGLDEFQKIRTNPHSTQYRRSLAAINEAWVLWDLGQWKPLEKLRSEVPEGFRHRIDLVLELHSGQTKLAREWAAFGIPNNVAAAEINKIAIHLAEASKVFELENIQALKYLLNLRLSKNNDSPCAILKAAMNLLNQSGKSEKVVEGQLSWREKMEFFHLKMLSTNSPQEANEIYRSNLLPIIEKHNIENPLIPNIQNGSLLNDNPWTNRICKLLNLELQATRHRSPKFKLVGESLEFEGMEILNLKKMPVAQKIMRILSAPKGKTFSKRFIHEQLTASRYTSYLHDSRLHKILKRLALRIIEAGAPEPWSLPGDNTIRINVDIEAEFQ